MDNIKKIILKEVTRILNEKNIKIIINENTKLFSSGLLTSIDMLDLVLSLESYDLILNIDRNSEFKECIIKLDDINSINNLIE